VPTLSLSTTHVVYTSVPCQPSPEETRDARLLGWGISSVPERQRHLLTSGRKTIATKDLALLSCYRTCVTTTYYSVCCVLLSVSYKPSSSKVCTQTTTSCRNNIISHCARRKTCFSTWWFFLTSIRKKKSRSLPPRQKTEVEEPVFRR